MAEYKSGLVLAINQNDTELITVNNVKKYVNFLLKAEDYDNFKLKTLKDDVQVIYAEEEGAEEQENIDISLIVLTFKKKATINEQEGIKAFLSNLGFVTRVVSWDNTIEGSTDVYDPQGNMIRTIYSIEQMVDAEKVQQILRDNPYLTAIHTYPATIVDIDYSSLPLGYVFTPGVFNNSGSKYSEGTVAYPDNNARITDVLAEISDDEASNGVDKCLKCSASTLDGKDTIGVRQHWGHNVVIDGVQGSYHVEGKLEITTEVKVPKTSLARFFNFNTLNVWFNTFSGHLFAYDYPNYPNDNTRVRVTAGVPSNPFDWHTWKFLLDISPELAKPSLKVYRDDILLLDVNPGAMSTMARRRSQYFLQWNRRPLQALDRFYIKNLKVVSYSKLQTR